MAAADASDGCWIDRSHLAAIRMADVSCCSTQVGYQGKFRKRVELCVTAALDYGLQLLPCAAASDRHSAFCKLCGAFTHRPVSSEQVVNNRGSHAEAQVGCLMVM